MKIEKLWKGSNLETARRKKEKKKEGEKEKSKKETGRERDQRSWKEWVKCMIGKIIERIKDEEREEK